MFETIVKKEGLTFLGVAGSPGLPGSTRKESKRLHAENYAGIRGKAGGCRKGAGL